MLGTVSLTMLFDLKLLTLLNHENHEKFWQRQDMIYDFQVELHGTGSCSLYSS